MIGNGIGQGSERESPISKAGVANDSLNLRVAHLNFLGRGLVRLAHDLKNHLATINESAGLMADLLKLKHEQRLGWAGRLFKRGQAQRLDIAPFLSDLNGIQKEVVQLATLIRHLGRFAHRLEETQSVFEGNAVLEEIRDVLVERARKKGISLEIRLSKTTPMIKTDPSRFQMAVLCNVEKVMRGLEEGYRVVLEATVREGLFQVCLSSSCPEHPPRFASEKLEDEGFCRGIVEELGGQIWNRSGHGKYAVTLSFPLANGKT